MESKIEMIVMEDLLFSQVKNQTKVSDFITSIKQSPRLTPLVMTPILDTIGSSPTILAFT